MQRRRRGSFTWVQPEEAPWSGAGWWVLLPANRLIARFGKSGADKQQNFDLIFTRCGGRFGGVLFGEKLDAADERGKFR